MTKITNQFEIPVSKNEAVVFKSLKNNLCVSNSGKLIILLSAAAK